MLLAIAHGCFPYVCDCWVQLDDRYDRILFFELSGMGYPRHSIAKASSHTSEQWNPFQSSTSRDRFLSVAGSKVVTPFSQNAIFYDGVLIKRQIKTSPSLLLCSKQHGFILRLCWKSLSGQCFISQKITEKNERWTFSPLIKSRADLVLRGRPLFCISASLFSQRCFFYIPLGQKKLPAQPVSSRIIFRYKLRTMP